MQTFKAGKTYTFTKRKCGHVKGLKQIQKLVYVEHFAALEIFRSAIAPWLETFIPEQLKDYDIKEVA